jgi:hypothetical protein
MCRARPWEVYQSTAAKGLGGTRQWKSSRNKEKTKRWESSTKHTGNYENVNGVNNQR